MWPRVLAPWTVLVSAILWIAAGAGLAEETYPKFRVDGDRLIFDTYNVPEGVEDSLDTGDVKGLRHMLEANPGISVLELNSSGGSLWGARKMSDVIIDYELDTHVHGDCNSSCVRLFLSGKDRSMSRGSRMGFHRTWWSSKSIESYYGSEAEQEGWNSAFDMASWIYEDTQREVHESLMFMIERGVDPLFAIQTLKSPSSNMWFPYRLKLRAAGVLTK